MDEHIVKSYKIVCRGCGDVRFKPYITHETAKKRSKKSGCLAGLLSVGFMSCCPPIGLCMAVDGAKNAFAATQDEDTWLKTYTQSHKCDKCGSQSLEVSVNELNIRHLKK